MIRENKRMILDAADGDNNHNNNNKMAKNIPYMFEDKNASSFSWPNQKFIEIYRIKYLITRGFT